MELLGSGASSLGTGSCAWCPCQKRCTSSGHQWEGLRKTSIQSCSLGNRWVHGTSFCAQKVSWKQPRFFDQNCWLFKNVGQSGILPEKVGSSFSFQGKRNQWWKSTPWAPHPVTEIILPTSGLWPKQKLENESTTPTEQRILHWLHTWSLKNISRNCWTSLT